MTANLRVEYQIVSPLFYSTTGVDFADLLMYPRQIDRQPLRLFYSLQSFLFECKKSNKKEKSFATYNLLVPVARDVKSNKFMCFLKKMTRRLSNIR